MGNMPTRLVVPDWFTISQGRRLGLARWYTLSPPLPPMANVQKPQYHQNPLTSERFLDNDAG